MRARRSCLLLAIDILGGGCVRAGFDPRLDASDALTDGARDGSPSEELAADGGPDAAGDAATIPQVCFKPRVDLVPCGGPRCTEPAPTSVALADLDGDGDLDLVMGDTFVGVIAVHLGRGDGTFEPPADYTIDWDALAVAVADLDEDGVLDIAAASHNASGVHIYRGDRSGAFLPPSTVPGPSNPTDLVVADVDRDGHLDLVTSSSNNKVELIRGEGGGSFAPATTLAINLHNYYAVGLADLNGDGALDVAATDYVTTLSVLIQNPSDTTFAQSDIEIPSVNTVLPIAAGDFDADGFVDLSVAAYSGEVTLLMGDGSDTTFTQKSIAVGPHPMWVTTADVNGDDKLDLLVTQDNGGLLSVLPGRGDGTFGPRVDFPLDTSVDRGSIFGSAKIAIGDIDGDGQVDIVCANPAGGNVAVLLSDRPCAP